MKYCRAMVLEDFYRNGFQKPGEPHKGVFLSRLEKECLSLSNFFPSDTKGFKAYKGIIMPEMKAVRDYLQLLDRTNPFVGYNKAVVNLGLENYIAAYVHARKDAFGNFNGNVRGKSDALNFLGYVFWHMNDMIWAEIFYKRALEHDKTNTKPHTNLGVVNILKGDIEEAKKYLKKALEIDPTNKMACMYVGACSELEQKRIPDIFKKKGYGFLENRKMMRRIQTQYPTLLDLLLKEEKAMFVHVISEDKKKRNAFFIVHDANRAYVIGSDGNEMDETAMGKLPDNLEKVLRKAISIAQSPNPQSSWILHHPTGKLVDENGKVIEEIEEITVL